jgi:hypothetical protein
VHRIQEVGLAETLGFASCRRIQEAHAAAVLGRCWAHLQSLAGDACWAQTQEAGRLEGVLDVEGVATA